MSAADRPSVGPAAERRPSVKDVAERAGVSWKTVSNVVNGRTNVRAETRERVEAAIRDLGYKTSLAGRQLRSGRTQLLAVAFPELTTPYFASLAHEIIGAAEGHGYTVLISETNGRAESERHVARGFDTQFADGIILSPTSLDSASVLEAHGPIPLVLLGERVDGSHLDHVVIDNEASALEATEHLLALGRRSLVFLGAHPSQPYGTGWLRMLGFRAALEAAGMAFDVTRVVQVAPYDRATGAETVRRLVDSGLEFDGLVCASDLIAMGAMRMLRELGASVPDDVAVLGWDGTAEAEYSNPALTTVALDTAHIAKEAVDLIVHRIAAPKAPPQEVSVGHVLLVRESTTGASPAASR